MRTKKTKVSKFLSFILRHNPKKFGLDVDEFGFVEIEKIIKILSSRYPWVDKRFLGTLVSKDKKQRYEIKKGKIRARYGHTIKVKTVAEKSEPPELLYHGTSARSANRILKIGLFPMGRQYVHLSQTPQEARKIGLRHSRSPIILVIDAKSAYSSGIEFIKEGTVYLTKHIPQRYIKRYEEDILERISKEFEIKEEDDKIQRIARFADRISSLIVASDYPKIDIEIQKRKLKELCKKLFPEKAYLYELLYESRFRRLWKQFREQQ